MTESHAHRMKDSGGRAATADEAGAADWDGKFAVPLATHLVSRPRLHARLTAGLECSCTLIAAVAGLEIRQSVRNSPFNRLFIVFPCPCQRPRL